LLGDDGRRSKSDDRTVLMSGSFTSLWGAVDWGAFCGTEGQDEATA
jgi:hypothetical protein